MNSKEFLSEIGFDVTGPRQSSASSAEVRDAFLKDFFNDAFQALNTAIQTGVVTIQPTSTSTTQPTLNLRPDQAPGASDIASVRAAKQKAAQAKIDQLSNPQYKQPKTPKFNVNKDPNFVLEAIDNLSKIYLTEQQGMSVSEFLNDFFADYVAGANANYSKYEPMIKDLTKKIENQWAANPKGTMGLGYNKNIRTWMTQLGDLALTIYKTKKGSLGRETPTKANLAKATDILLPDYLTNTSQQTQEPENQNQTQTPKQTEVLVGGKKWMYGPRGWVDDKGTIASQSMVQMIDQYLADPSAPTTTSPTQSSVSGSKVRQYIKNLNTRQKQQLINYINQTMPAGQDLN